jgi:NAD(P)-dependent dehydrogenase (short-subunit alcohol dehydrogenase family)
MSTARVPAAAAQLGGRPLENKVAIITGASRGIDAAAAQAFNAAGATVVLAARDVNDVAEQITSTGGNAFAIPTDVGDPEAAEQLVQQTLRAFGRLDVAFNNAGQGHMPTPLADLSINDFDSALRVNAHGIFLMMKYQIRAMVESGGGAIAPGPILTHNLARADEGARARIADHLPLHRLGRPEEVATTAVWLCSDQASFINGATVPIDGGKLAGSAAL